MTPVPVSMPVPSVPFPPPAADSFDPTDLDRLRELIQSTASQTVNPPGSATVDAVRIDVTQPTWGDSVLASVLRFSNNYQNSMRSIETRLQEVVQTEGSGLNNFSEILALQIDVSKWSMSVMGVDNASKAGSNTIKELSRGG